MFTFYAFTLKYILFFLVYRLIYVSLHGQSIEMILNISIIGAGNVAYHLVKALCKQAEVHLVQLYSRGETPKDFEHFPVERVHDFSLLRSVDICILAVKDDAIAEVSRQLPYSGGLVVHTSGNTPMEAIDPKHRRGVFYPLQSFSIGSSIDFEQIPICLEAEHKSDMESLLKPLAGLLSSKIYELNGYQRRMLHVAAVFANNFTNHLIALSEGICKENHIPFEILQPLISGTFEKLEHLDPVKAQTGPARRNDAQTIGEHLGLLSGERRKIYEIITDSIIKTYEREKL